MGLLLSIIVLVTRLCLWQHLYNSIIVFCIVDACQVSLILWQQAAAIVRQQLWYTCVSEVIN